MQLVSNLPMPLNAMLLGGSCVAVYLLYRLARGKTPLSLLHQEVHHSVYTANEGFVSLRGRIEADEPCARFEDGKDAIVTQFVARPGNDPLVQTQGEGLFLVVGEERVVLGGRISLLHAARQRRRRWRYPADKPILGRLLCADSTALEMVGQVHRPLFQSVAIGDDVEVTGHLSRQATTDGMAGYRQLAQRWILRPAAGGTLLVAAPASLNLRRGVATVGVILLAIAGVLAGLSSP